MEGYGNPVEGDAVASLTAAFLEMWEASGKTPADVDVLDIEAQKNIWYSIRIRQSRRDISTVCGLPVRRNPGWRGCLYQYRQQSGQILFGS